MPTDMVGFGYSTVLNWGAQNGAFWFEAIGADSSRAVAMPGLTCTEMVVRAIIFGLYLSGAYLRQVGQFSCGCRGDLGHEAA
jgi:hypothetical protein